MIFICTSYNDFCSALNKRLCHGKPYTAVPPVIRATLPSSSLSLSVGITIGTTFCSLVIIISVCSLFFIKFFILILKYIFLFNRRIMIKQFYKIVHTLNINFNIYIFFKLILQLFWVNPPQLCYG